MRPTLLPPQAYSALVLFAPCCLFLHIAFVEGGHSEDKAKDRSMTRGPQQSSTVAGTVAGAGGEGGGGGGGLEVTPGGLSRPSRSPFIHYWSRGKTDYNKRQTARLLIPGLPDFHNGCSQMLGGPRQYRCPLATTRNTCIGEHHLCNGRSECPHGEDEDPTMCLFYRFITDNVKMLVHALLREELVKR